MNIIAWITARFPVSMLVELAISILVQINAKDRFRIAREELARDMSIKVIDAVDDLVQRAEKAFTNKLGTEKAAWVMKTLGSEHITDFIDDPELPELWAKTATSFRNAALEYAVRKLKAIG